MTKNLTKKTFNLKEVQEEEKEEERKEILTI